MVMTQIFVELKFSADVTELDGSGSLSSVRRADNQRHSPVDYSLNGSTYLIMFRVCQR